MLGFCRSSQPQCAVCFLLLCSPVLAAVELGQAVGDFSVLDARDKPLLVTTSPERTAIALIFLSSRSDAVDQSLQTSARCTGSTGVWASSILASAQTKSNPRKNSETLHVIGD